MVNRQYVACKFRPTDTRIYTYANEGEPVGVGDKVKVPAREGGWQTVTVAEVLTKAPRFECKLIEGIIEKAKPADKPAEPEGLL